LLRGRQVLHVQGAAAVAQADAGRARALLAGDIGGRTIALVGEDALDGRADGLGCDAQLARARGDQFVGGIGRRGLVGADRIVWVRRRIGGAGGKTGDAGGGGETGKDQLAAVHGVGSEGGDGSPDSRGRWLSPSPVFESALRRQG